MKCAVCGKEFGSDNHCQNCGTDRVTGLGNYSGYNAPISSVMNDEEHVSKPKPESQSIISQHQMTAIGSIVCYACGEVIPDNSKFCPYCGQELYVDCPRCGHTYSSKYPICNQCGTNREEFIKILKRQEDDEREREERERQNIERLTREFENRKILKEQTPEGRAELEKERRYIEECRKKWRNK